jgi:hypothetical protein
MQNNSCPPVERFYVYNTDKLVGVLTRDARGVFAFESSSKDDFTRRAIETRCFCGDSDAISAAISDIIMPPDRVDVASQLSLLGLPYYDEWEIFKRIRGMSGNDCVWMSERPDCGAEYWEFHPFAATFWTGSELVCSVARPHRSQPEIPREQF